MYEQRGASIVGMPPVCAVLQGDACMASAMSRPDSPDEDERIIRIDDQHLLVEIRAGNITAFEGLVRRFVNPLVRYATAHTGSVMTAEDIVQDVFTSLWMRRESLALTYSIKTYLFRAVHHQVANHHRSVRRRSQYILDAESSEAEQASLDEVFQLRADDPLNADELRLAYTRCLDQLPRRPREVFLLVREQGMSYREAAQVLGISVRTIEEHMGRALLLLRKALTDWLS